MVNNEAEDVDPLREGRDVKWLLCVDGRKQHFPADVEQGGRVDALAVNPNPVGAGIGVD